MLIRHSAIYLIARGLPAVIGLFSLAIYTRLLDADQYGQFTLVFGAAALTHGLFYSWLWSGLSRFLVLYQAKQSVIFSVVLRSFAALSLLGGILGSILALTWPHDDTRILIWLAIPLFWLMGWFQINLDLDRAQLRPLRYTLLSLLKSVITVTAASGLAYLGFGAEGLLWGAIVGMLIPLLAGARGAWIQGFRSRFDPSTLVELTRYGLPLTAAFVMTMLIFTTDRLLLGWLLGAEQAGLYAVAYDLAHKTLFTLSITVGLAGFPLAVRALEQAGESAARRQLISNGTLLLATLSPAAVGMLILTEPIVNIFLGAQYRDTAMIIMPWIVLGSSLAGITHAYLDYAFSLARATGLLALITTVAALINLVLNLLWIPMFGVTGAAYSTVAAFTAFTIMSWWLGRKVFPIPLPWRNGLRVLLPTGLMGAALLLAGTPETTLGLLAQMTTGALLYGALLLVFNPDHYRPRTMAWLARSTLLPTNTSGSDRHT